MFILTCVAWLRVNLCGVLVRLGLREVDRSVYYPVVTRAHLVTPSPWPAVAAMAVFTCLVSCVNWFSGYVAWWVPVFSGFVLVGVVLLWVRDVLRESGLGEQWSSVSVGLRCGMVLFIVSEVLFFTGFFWCYFHCSRVPADMLGCTWPSMLLLDPFTVPVMNTVVLLGSGVVVT